MKKLIIIFICILYKNSTAQTYFPFPDTTSFWHSVGFDHGSYQEYSFLFGIHGDTIIDNHNYSKVYRTSDTAFSSNLEYVCALRENDNKQVLIKLPAIPEIIPEFVLYDFNLNVGDTIYYPTGCAINQNYWIWNYVNSYRVVQSIDSILLDNGEFRKRWKLYYPWIYGNEDQWVEGIGSIGKFGLLYPLVSGIYSNMYNYFFGCFMELNNILYFDSTICYTCLGGYMYYESINNPVNQLNSNLIYNPFNKTISLESQNNNDNYYIEIFNQFGQLVLKDSSMGYERVTFDVNFLPNGIYFYKVSKGKSSINTGKILII